MTPMPPMSDKMIRYTLLRKLRGEKERINVEKPVYTLLCRVERALIWVTWYHENLDAIELSDCEKPPVLSSSSLLLFLEKRDLGGLLLS